MLDTLYKIIEYVESPKPALIYATPGERVLRAHPGDPALEVMRRMEKHGFSHVPVLEKGGISGIFSMRGVFSYVLKHGGVGEDTRVRDFGELLEMNRPGGERFLLLPASATYHDVRDAFERASERDSRLAAVFITENGKLDEPLMGMLTPWDVLGEKPDHRRNAIKMDDNLMLHQAVPDGGRLRGRADAAFAEEYRNYQQRAERVHGRHPRDTRAAGDAGYGVPVPPQAQPHPPHPEPGQRRCRAS